MPYNKIIYINEEDKENFDKLSKIDDNFSRAVRMAVDVFVNTKFSAPAFNSSIETWNNYFSKMKKDDILKFQKKIHEIDTVFRTYLEMHI